MPESFVHLIEVEGYSGDLRVLEFDGSEGLSQLFHFNVVVGSEATLDFASFVGKKATLTMRLPNTEDSRLVHAIVSRIEQLDPGVRHQNYRITLVPKAWKLLHRVTSRIFQEMTAVDVIKKVLEGAGLTSGDDYRLALQGTYSSREYCVQYRENDWDFVCRLMEDEGIFYYFEQKEDKHVLVLADKVAAYTDIDGDATLVFRLPQGAMGSIEAGTYVTRFYYGEEVRPGKVILRDFNFKKPSLSLETNTQGPTFADLEIYDYPGDYEVPGDGTTIAQTRLEELATRQKSADGDSTCTRFLPGFTFTLSEHPVDAHNQKLLITRVEHYGVEPDAEVVDDEKQTPYRNRFEAIPATVLFRPPRVTRRPMIHGVQTAVVVGPPGEEIYTDEFGRVKVQFHWDRLGKKDDKSSCWIRVSQLWAGAGFGAMFLPRIQQEVVVTFLEGNPDRPLIVGRVYHAENVTPYKLPDEKTKSTVKSRSTPSGEAAETNELRFEDKKGSEEIYLHGQKDWTVKMENDHNEVIGHDATLEVGNDRTKHVKHDQTETVDNDDKITVKHDRTEEIGNDETVTVKHDRKTTIQNDETRDVTGNQTFTVGKDQSTTISGKQTIAVDKTLEVAVTGDVTQTYKAKLTQKITGDTSVKIDGKLEEKVTGDQTTEVGGKNTLKITGDSIEKITGKQSIAVTGEIKIECGAATVKIAPSGEITLEGVQIKIQGSGPVTVQGAQIDVKADAVANVKATLINVEGQGISKVKGAMVVLDGQMVSVG